MYEIGRNRRASYLKSFFLEKYSRKYVKDSKFSEFEFFGEMKKFSRNVLVLKTKLANENITDLYVNTEWRDNFFAKVRDLLIKTAAILHVEKLWR